MRKGQVIYSELQRLQETHPETKHAECSYYYHVNLSCCDKSKAWRRLSRRAESSTMSNWRGEDVVQHRPLVAAIRIEVTSENTEALSWFSIANQITVTKKLITTLTIFIVFFLNVFIFESGKESRCSFISYMRKKNKHHIHNDNQYSFATKRLFVEYKWFEWSELTHPHKQTNRLPSPPRADYRCEGQWIQIVQWNAAEEWGGYWGVEGRTKQEGRKVFRQRRGLRTSFNSTLLWKLQLPLSRLAPRPHCAASALFAAQSHPLTSTPGKTQVSSRVSFMHWGTIQTQLHTLEYVSGRVCASDQPNLLHAQKRYPKNIWWTQKNLWETRLQHISISS